MQLTQEARSREQTSSIVANDTSLHREASPKSWLGLDVRDARGSSALGAIVTAEGGTEIRRVRRGDSFLNSRDPRILRPATDAHLAVRWPTGGEVRVRPKPGRYTRIDPPSSEQEKSR